MVAARQTVLRPVGSALEAPRADRLIPLRRGLRAGHSTLPTIAASVPGRVRLRLDPSDVPAFERLFLDAIRARNGVRDARINPRCASVIVSYDPAHLSQRDVQFLVADVCRAQAHDRLAALIAGSHDSESALLRVINLLRRHAGESWELLLGGAVVVAGALLLGSLFGSAAWPVSILTNLLSPIISGAFGHHGSGYAQALQIATGPSYPDFIIGAAKAMLPEDMRRAAADPVRFATTAVGKRPSDAVAGTLDSARSAASGRRAARSAPRLQTAAA